MRFKRIPLCQIYPKVSNKTAGEKKPCLCCDSPGTTYPAIPVAEPVTTVIQELIPEETLSPVHVIAPIMRMTDRYFLFHCVHCSSYTSIMVIIRHW
jgi:hypothetical protein